MAMKKYRVTQMRVTVTVLEVDESLTPDDDFRKTFYDYKTLEDMAAHIAQNTALFGESAFVEGVGLASEGKFRIISQSSDWQDFDYPDFYTDECGVEEIQ